MYNNGVNLTIKAVQFVGKSKLNKRKSLNIK